MIGEAAGKLMVWGPVRNRTEAVGTTAVCIPTWKPSKLGHL